MPVHVRSEGLQERPISNARVREAAEAMLAAIDRNSAEVSILLCGDPLIHALNRDYRGKDRPTDVLAFAMTEGEGPVLHADLLGDVVISLPTARRQAAEHGKSIAEEVRFLLAHGLLHLLGYDHQTPPEYRRMMARQQVLMTAPAALWKKKRLAHRI